MNKPKRKQIRLPLDRYHGAQPFFITIATYNKYPWFGMYHELAARCEEIMIELARERGTRLYAWCVMPDHVHLLLEDENIIKFIGLLKGRLVTRARNLESTKKLWQRSFFDHGIRSDEGIMRAAGYIWENPVRGGLVSYPEEYRYSGSLVWPDWREYAGG